MIPLLLMFVGFIMWAYACDKLGVLREWHHAWIGVILYFLGWSWTGVAVLMDDAIQHFVQLYHPAFRSPLHLAYRYVVYTPWQYLKKWTGW
jgi:hypothetical protein